MAETLLAPIVLAAASIPALVASDWHGWRPGRYLFKPLSAVAFLWMALAAGATDSAYGIWLLAGLIASAVGDLSLMIERNAAFLTGLTAFLVGHLLYALAFVGITSNLCYVLVGGIPALVLAVGAARWLRPHLEPSMRTPVLAYIAVIAVMLACAGGTAGDTIAWFVVLGAWGFAVSDLAVARQQFVVKAKTNPLWGTPLYFGSQLLLAASPLAL